MFLALDLAWKLLLKLTGAKFCPQVHGCMAGWVIRWDECVSARTDQWASDGVLHSKRDLKCLTGLWLLSKTNVTSIQNGANRTKQCTDSPFSTSSGPGWAQGLFSACIQRGLPGLVHSSDCSIEPQAMKLHFKGDSPRWEIQMSEKKELRLTHKSSKGNQPLSKSLMEDLCVFHKAMLISYFFLAIVVSILCYCISAAVAPRKPGSYSSSISECCTQRLQNKCIRANLPHKCNEAAGWQPAVVIWLVGNEQRQSCFSAAQAYAEGSSSLRRGHSIRWTRKHIKSHIYYLSF